MTLLRWKDEYSVGIEAVDHEHRELIDLINRLHDELHSPAAMLTVPAFFGDLLKGISAHFALEEKIMRDHAYGELGSHKADHERLLDDLCDIMQSFEHSEEVDRMELAHRLDSWFSNHFRTHDAKFHRELDALPH
jgi:hemerythrin